MNRHRRIIAVCAALCILTSGLAAAENAAPPMNGNGGQPRMENGQPPERPDGENGRPPEMPDGENGLPPEMPDGENGRPPEMPDGENGRPPEMPDGMPGGTGGAQQPGSYAAVRTNEDAYSEHIDSTGTDESAILITEGDHDISCCILTRSSDDSTGGELASFYGVGAALLVTGGSAYANCLEIETDANGGAGVFAYGDGTVTIENSVIHTEQGASGGIHAAGGGTLYANNLTVTTEGASSAAIRSDRGGGTMVVNGGSYTASGAGSPAVYVTANIDISGAKLTATGSEALCLEGRNSVKLRDCDLSGSMKDDAQNDNTWTVILYQSMSGDSEVGKGTFEMTGGSLTSGNGGLFYTTNTDSEFTIRDVLITAADDCEYFLRCTGNANRRGWGRTGANGANCVFTAEMQEMCGDVIWDSISNLTLNIVESTVFTGAIVDDEACAGEGGNGSCCVTIDETSCWIVTGDSRLTRLDCKGSITDAEGRSVTVADMDGNVLVSGDSKYTITVSEYST